MTSVLLSCRCKRNYSPPPRAGDVLLCLNHGEVYVMNGTLLLTCEDCDYEESFSSLAPLSICTKATKHAISKAHRVLHETELDKPDTMCLHDHRKSLEFTYSPPPF